MTFNKVFGPGASSWESHVISAKDGLAMVHTAAQMEHPVPENDFHSIGFAYHGIQALLGQPNVEGLKAVKAHNGDHHTLVLFAVDKDGQIIAGDGAIALENGEQCPPFC